MFLDVLFKPKWQHRDPEVRARAVAALNVAQDAAVLREIAVNDPERRVRTAAIAKLTELPLLRELAAARDPDVAQAARGRAEGLLAGTEAVAPPLQERLGLIAGWPDGDTLERLAVQGREPELRLAALARVSREQLLAELAVSDPVAQVRIAAAQRLAGPTALEQVAKASRGRDKRVYRLVRDRLDALKEQAERPLKLRAECEVLCERMERLVRVGDWEGSHLEAEHLGQQWQSLEGPAPEELDARFAAARQAFQEGLAAHRQADEACSRLRKAKASICTALEERLRSLAGPSTHDVLETVEAEVRGREREWRALPALGAPEEGTLQRRFAEAREALMAQLRVLRELHTNAQALELLCEQADRLLASAAPLRKGELEALRERREGLRVTPGQRPALEALLNRFDEAVGALEERRRAQQGAQQKDLDRLKELLPALEQALEEGQLQTARPLEAQARELLGALQGAPKGILAPLETRLKAAGARVQSLVGWQRWGDSLEQERLCERVEGLVGSDRHPEELDRQIREARAAWKRLAPGRRDQAEAVWERFNAACERAGEPVRAYREAQAAERQANLERREELCARLERHVAETDWSAPDWKGTQRLAQQLRQEWRAIGPVDRKRHPAITRRFESAMATLEAPLAEERKRNLAERRALIARVEALAEGEDIRQAVEETKQAQGRWQVTVAGSRRAENELWKAFRGACDAVFARRQQQREARDQELQGNLARKTALCETLEGAGEAGPTEAAAVLATVRGEWQQIGPVPRKVESSLEKRLARAGQRVEALLEAERHKEERVRADALREKSLLCDRLERAEADQAESELTAVETAWEALPVLDESLERPLAVRLEHAREAARQGATPLHRPEEVEQDLVRVCIHMELAAGIEAPPEEAETRMACQVERLSEAMAGSGREGRMQEARELERRWYLLGPARRADLRERFERAREAFHRASS